MPTGYTYDVLGGIGFDEFVWSCARAFGALIHLRDERGDCLITKDNNVDSYYEKELSKAQQKLDEYSSMSLEDISKIIEKEKNNCNKEFLKYKKEKEEEKKNLTAMLVQVKEWNPPTSDHEGLKQFMVDQLISSIEDCSIEPKWWEYSRPQDPTSWKNQRIAELKRDVSRLQASVEKEKSYAQKRNKWIDDLDGSVPCPKKIKGF